MVVNHKKEFILVKILTTKEVAEYLNLHQLTICKYAAKDLISAIRIGRFGRFEKEAIDEWLYSGQNKNKILENSKRKTSI